MFSDVPTPVFIRSPYNYDTDAASLETALECPPPSMTHQAFKDECDINVIVERFGLTGVLPGAVRMPEYGDFSEVVDYHTAWNALRSADESFMAMPAKVRERFGNDPQAFLEFCADEANREEATRLGLVNAPAPDPNRPKEPPAPVPN